MVSKVVSKLRRAKYIIQRLRESPFKFLLLKASIELRKKTQRSLVMKAVATGQRFHDGFGQGLAAKRALGSKLRTCIVQEVRALGIGDQALLQHLASGFDSGKWHCLGYGEYTLRPGHWSLDDFHDFTWPRDYFADINYVMADTRCDTKVPWEKSRMQWFCNAGLACCIDQDESTRERRKKDAIYLFKDWVDENPYGVGVNWVSSMEVAIRAINILMAFSFLEDQLDDSTAESLLTCVGEHLHYLKHFPETSDVQGNHYLATALGEYFLEEFRGTAKKDQARAFVSACEEQFSSEGFHIEFSPTYHRLSLDMVAIGFAIMKRQQPTIAGQLEPLLHRGIGACCSLANHCGELPVFSDNDSGMVLNFHQSARRFGAYGSLPISGDSAIELCCSTAGVAEQIFGATLAGLAGENRSSSGKALEESKPTSLVKAIELPPFVALEKGKHKVVVRAGALGLAGRASHDHDDALSFWYSIDGKDFIVETGCPPYTRDKRERSYAIASTSHNLLTVSGQERFSGVAGSVTLTPRGGPEGRFAIEGTPTNPRLRSRLVLGDALKASSGLSTHERTFWYEGDSKLVILDEATFMGPRPFMLYFHLAPGINAKDIQLTSAQRVEVTTNSRVVVLELDGCGVDRISVEPYLCCLEYGGAEQAYCLTVCGRAGDSLNLRTVISCPSRLEGAQC
jgi:hypothetical protein